MEPRFEKKYLEEPQRKNWGWSPYTEERTVTYGYPDLISRIKRATVRGKKLCLFGRFIWDYEISITSYFDSKSK